jgi:hypothetical protein
MSRRRGGESVPDTAQKKAALGSAAAFGPIEDDAQFARSGAEISPDME